MPYDEKHSYYARKDPGENPAQEIELERGGRLKYLKSVLHQFYEMRTARYL